VTWWRPCRL